jgi:very-short-patch-repair endonuclease
MIKCKLCDKEMKGLTLHILKKHSITPKQYVELFPGSKMFSDETLNDPSFGGKHLKGKTVAPFTDEHRRKLSEARSNHIGWSHSQETITRMRDTWESQRDSRLLIMKEVNSRPEVKAKKSKTMKDKISRNGYHLKRGTTTKLERKIINILELNNISFKRESRSEEKLLGVYRYFDFYLPDHNIILEIDGEYWHQQPNRIEIDMLKEFDAKTNNSFLRLSDVFSREILENDSLLIDLILDKSKHESYTREVMRLREASLALKDLVQKV